MFKYKMIMKFNVCGDPTLIVNTSTFADIFADLPSMTIGDSML